MSMSMELAKAAYKLIKVVMLTKEGENVVIYADTASDKSVVDATANAAYIVGAIPTVLWYETRPEPIIEPPKPVAAAMAAGDVVIEYSAAYIYATKAYEEALKAGARYICLTGMTTDMLIRTVEKVDYDKMIELGDKLCELTRKAETIKITSPAGTDVTAKMDGRPVTQFGRKATEKGTAYMLGGQVGWCPLEETINGTAVYDGIVYPPDMGLLTEPITCRIEKGWIKDIKGGSQALRFKAWLDGFKDPNMYRIAHFTYGLNPGVQRLTGIILEDERAFGVQVFGMGIQGGLIVGRLEPAWRAASHTDGIMLNPSVWLDDVQIEKEGKWIHPELVKICKEMKIPGY